MARGRKKKKKKSSSDELTPLELELMKIIWRKGDATAAELRADLKKDRPLAQTTVHTVLANLRSKGYVQLIPTVERALRYAPTVSMETAGEHSLKKIVRQFFGGSTKRLMAHLIKEKDLSEEELKEIRKMMESTSKKGGDLS